MEFHVIHLLKKKEKIRTGRDKKNSRGKDNKIKVIRPERRKTGVHIEEMMITGRGRSTDNLVGLKASFRA